MSVRHIVGDIQDALRQLKSPAESSFQHKRREGARMLLQGALKRLVESTKGDPALHPLALKLSESREEDMPRILEQIAGKVSERKESTTNFSAHFVPVDVRDVITADLQEVQSCMNAQCYRSAMILCGRVLETALHRKYFDATGQDLLEKAPGTGLGNLIAKLAEKGVQLDPGLPNQIHLINQVRVFSVHTKQQAFTPTKLQAEAIVLYTLDILEKLFK